MKKYILILVTLWIFTCNDLEEELGKKKKDKDGDCALGYVICLYQHQTCTDNCYTSNPPTLTPEQYCTAQQFSICSENTM